MIAAGILAAAVTACGQKQTEPAAETASTQQTTDAETVTTASSTEAAAEAVTEAATTAATEAATTAATEASAETATETAEQKDPYDLGIQYTDDCVGTLVGSDATMQIVVIGDSQFGNYKGYDGLASMVSQYCHANVYNLAIGGTTAAVQLTDGQDMRSWDSDCGLGLPAELLKY